MRTKVLKAAARIGYLAFRGFEIALVTSAFWAAMFMSLELEKVPLRDRGLIATFQVVGVWLSCALLYRGARAIGWEESFPHRITWFCVWFTVGMWWGPVLILLARFIF